MGPGDQHQSASERLKRLEQQDLIHRRILRPPAGSTVYELTALGQALERTLRELRKWGSQFVPPSMDGVTVKMAVHTAIIENTTTCGRMPTARAPLREHLRGHFVFRCSSRSTALRASGKETVER